MPLRSFAKAIVNAVGLDHRDVGDAYRVIHGHVEKTLHKNKVLRQARSFDPYPVLLDIGSADGIPREWAQVCRQKLVTVLAFDPNQNWTRGDVQSIPYAIGDRDGVAILHSTFHPGCSSFKTPNKDVVQTFSRGFWFDIIGNVEVEIRRLDTLIDDQKCLPPHFVKIDVQAYEFEAFTGFGKYMDQVLGIEMETQFRELYLDQKTFTEMNKFLRENGFVIRDIRPQWLCSSELIEANVYYSRAPRSPWEENALRLWEVVNNIWKPAHLTENPDLEKILIPQLGHV
jgi:FkbM family methyltransferase